MALRPCKGCKKEVDATAKACPHCGRPNPTTSDAVKAIGGLAVLGVVAFFVFGDHSLFGGDVGHAIDSVNQAATAKIENDVNRQVIDDAEKQYGIAKRNGTRMDASVQAGLVSAAMVQAHDEDGYKKWKAIEKSDCGRAGVPQ